MQYEKPSITVIGTFAAVTQQLKEVGGADGVEIMLADGTIVTGS